MSESLKKQILDQVQDVLAFKIDVDTFENWIMSHTWNAHQHADADLQQIVDGVQGTIIARSCGELNDAQFRDELSSLLERHSSHDREVGEVEVYEASS